MISFMKYIFTNESRDKPETNKTEELKKCLEALHNPVEKKDEVATEKKRMDETIKSSHCFTQSGKFSDQDESEDNILMKISILEPQ